MSRETPIASALDAEQVARKAVEAAQQRALEIRSEARNEARRLEQIAEARIQRIHAGVEARLASRLSMIEASGDAAVGRLKVDRVPSEALADVIAAIVRELIEDERPERPGQ